MELESEVLIIVMLNKIGKKIVKKIEGGFANTRGLVAVVKKKRGANSEQPGGKCAAAEVFSLAAGALLVL